MNYYTTAEWNKEIWREAGKIYHQAFAEEGRKTEVIIRRMFEKQMGHLHMASLNNEIIAMAITGRSKAYNVLILDYMATKEEHRSKGYGGLFLKYIKNWAEAKGYKGIVVEVEAESSPENSRRIRFWEKSEFQLTEYVHHYIWVPEPYRAMFLNFDQADRFPQEGERLFRYITQFHKEAYSKL